MFSPPAEVSVPQNFNQFHGSPHYLDDEQFPLTEEDESKGHNHNDTHEFDTPEFQQKLQQKRDHCIQQLMTSEKYYVSQLKQVNDMFIQPFQHSHERNSLMHSDNVLSELQYHTLFDDLINIYHFNVKLYQSLENKFSQFNQENLLVGDVFLQFIPNLTFYQKYAQNYEKSLTLLFELESNTTVCVN
ncbi:RhoGEF domain-containing protein [Reticulomyxa filosa]|uniref:RhoGEF domain-containing protein n=1 Tax=Reticulomyxa filosa TaxID=46433 RepID=X6MMY9_RETFI|nr:RhoGEF domain-containing protein [Reticulomyxa filosa]|eukprot:ETO15026.1 RhoGEF domain-containing protein [Reticulomyxa filosa]